MPEPQQPSLRRLALGLALVFAALVQVHALLQTVGTQARQRERVVREERRAILGAAPRVGLALEAGDPAASRAAMREIVALSRAAEVEVYEPAGRPVAAYPAPAPVAHWPSTGELSGLRGGGVLTVGPIGGEGGRLLSYVVVRAGDATRILRLAREAPELVAGLRDGQRSMMTHGAALVVLVLALALLVGRPGDGRGSSPRALLAYEEAMDRLRTSGLELTRRHDAERRVLEAHLEDQEALARAGELTAGIVHEVRNGLSTILGHARLIEGVAASGDSARAIREECETLETVVRRFMEFVKREELRAAPFSLARLLGRVVARESRSRPGAAVSVAAAPDQDDTLVGDEELLERAFENLVRNAREAAGPGGRVAVTIEAEDDQRRVRIADNGPGLSPEARAGLRLFFTTKPGGLGLGLALAFKIVHLHGGSLELLDNRPRGLVATVRLSTGPRAADPMVTQGSAPGVFGPTGRTGYPESSA